MTDCTRFLGESLPGVHTPSRTRSHPLPVSPKPWLHLLGLALAPSACELPIFQPRVSGSPSAVAVVRCEQAAGRSCFSVGKGGARTSWCKGEEQCFLEVFNPESTVFSLWCPMRGAGESDPGLSIGCVGAGDTDDVTSSHVISSTYVII